MAGSGILLKYRRNPDKISIPRTDPLISWFRGAWRLPAFRKRFQPVFISGDQGALLLTRPSLELLFAGGCRGSIRIFLAVGNWSIVLACAVREVGCDTRVYPAVLLYQVDPPRRHAVSVKSAPHGMDRKGFPRLAMLARDRLTRTDPLSGPSRAPLDSLRSLGAGSQEPIRSRGVRRGRQRRPLLTPQT